MPTPAVQFSGGEPTMRDDLPELIRDAKRLGFSQVQIATNGVRIAKEDGYVETLKEAGLSTLYLHFDGVSRATNPFLAIHERALERCMAARMGVVLVPTVIHGRNDHEVGDIVRYAAERIRVVRGVNFQPVAFTGAASEDDVEKERVTIPDLTAALEAQTDGVIRQADFYPVPCVMPILAPGRGLHGQPRGRVHDPPALRGRDLRLRERRGHHAREPDHRRGPVLRLDSTGWRAPSPGAGR